MNSEYDVSASENPTAVAATAYAIQSLDELNCKPQT